MDEQPIQIVQSNTELYSEKLIDRLTSRKFIVTLVTLLLSSLMLSLNSIDAEQFKAIVIFISGTYIAGNITQKYVTK